MTGGVPQHPAVRRGRYPFSPQVHPVSLLTAAWVAGRVAGTVSGCLEGVLTTLCFMDTETTGLEPDADVWDFACILRRGGEQDYEVQFLVEHDTAKAARLSEPFLSDYRARFTGTAVGRRQAARWVQELTRGVTVVGAVPDFDTTRLARLLRGEGLEPAWHYHLCDVENLAVGYLMGRGRRSDIPVAQPPWDSEALSLAVGVDPQQFERHTALGDARWVRAIYDAVMTP